MTNANGEAIVRGLDDSDEYFFEEVVAPEGYSINETDSPVVWDTEGEGAAAATRAGKATMSDTNFLLFHYHPPVELVQLSSPLAVALL